VGEGNNSDDVFFMRRVGGSNDSLLRERIGKREDGKEGDRKRRNPNVQEKVKTATREVRTERPQKRKVLRGYKNNCGPQKRGKELADLIQTVRLRRFQGVIGV